MKPAVLFDLGNTLAAYYRACEFEPILEKVVDCLLAELRSRGLTTVAFETAMAAAIAENREAPDFRVIPLQERLERVLGVSLADDDELAMALCRQFLRPVFSLGRLYEETPAVLARLRQAGHPIGVVSNTPWGSPAGLWRQEITRLGLASSVDSTVFCGDVGWRKPAPAIFEFAAASVARECRDCVFVGDDPHWDVEGSRRNGMHPILVDRDFRHTDYHGDRVSDLSGVIRVLGLD